MGSPETRNEPEHPLTDPNLKPTPKLILALLMWLGRPVSKDELMQITGLDERAVRRSLSCLTGDLQLLDKLYEPDKITASWVVKEQINVAFKSISTGQGDGLKSPGGMVFKDHGNIKTNEINILENTECPEGMVSRDHGLKSPPPPKKAISEAKAYEEFLKTLDKDLPDDLRELAIDLWKTARQASTKKLPDENSDKSDEDNWNLSPEEAHKNYMKELEKAYKDNGLEFNTELIEPATPEIIRKKTSPQEITKNILKQIQEIRNSR